jgi:1A family penicillin-binding protein
MKQKKSTKVAKSAKGIYTRSPFQQSLIFILSALAGIGDAIRSILHFCTAAIARIIAFLTSFHQWKFHVQRIYMGKSARKVLKVVTRGLHTIGHIALTSLLFLLFIPRHILRFTMSEFIHVRAKWKSAKIRLSLSKLRLDRMFKKQKKTIADPKITPQTIQETVTPRVKKVLLETPWDRVKYFVFGIAATIFFFFIPFLAYQWLYSLPNPKLLTRRDLEVSTKILDRNGVLLYEFYSEQNRTPIPLSDMPKYVKDATISIEDRDFYRHSGFSVKAIVRAIREISVKGQVQGGSTITQQLIKSALLTPEIKLSRKIKEIVLAFWAERMFTKEQVLEMYLNQVPYGGTSWGIEAASRTYFGKSVKDISLAEAALLAGLPAAPTEYSPFGTHPEKAFQRQAEVLRRMVEDGSLTKEDAEKAFSEPIHFVAPRVAIRAPHFVMYVKDVLEKRYGTRRVEQGGLRVVTSLDVNIQEKAQDIVTQQVASIQRLNVGNGAAVVTNPKTGEILAMVGSKNYFDIGSEGNVNVTTALRQPGSSIKVVTYSLALENGYTPASIIDDSPVVYSVPGSPPYAPVNYDGKFHGPTPIRYTLANSYNIPAVKLAAKLGVSGIVDKARAMGIESWTDESRFGLSITLGAGDVTLLDMAKVFGTLANAGRRVELMPILEVTDYTGKVYEKNQPRKGPQAVKPEVAWIIGNILADNAARTPAFGPNSALVIPGKTVSVKTGTSNDKRDNWTIGYTPSYVVTTWVGNNNNAPMNPYLASGITGAAPIWHDVMVELLKDKPEETFPKPDNVVSIPCYFNRPEYFVRGTEPTSGRCASLPTPNPSGSPKPTKSP